MSYNPNNRCYKKVDEMIAKGYDIQDISEYIDSLYECGSITYTEIDNMMEYLNTKIK